MKEMKSNQAYVPEVQYGSEICNLQDYLLIYRYKKFFSPS